MSSDYSRRDLLRHIGVSLTLQQVHQAVAQGNFPKTLNAHEYATLQRLSDLIMPADEHSPGALAAGAAAFIDFLCSASDEMKLIYTGGLAWLDDAMKHRYGNDFLGAAPAQQTAMLDLIAYRENRRQDPSLGPGIDFFTWARKMVADAYYTSPIGIKDLGYLGNTAMSHFSVPQEAIDYAVKRSPVG